MKIFFRKLLKDKTNNSIVQFFRSIFVGGAAFAVDFAILYIATDYFGIHYLISAVISFAFGLVTAYLLSILWVFKDRLLDEVWKEFFIFTCIGIVGLLLNEILLWFFSDIIMIHYLISKILVTGIIFPVNFGLRKLFLFN